LFTLGTPLLVWNHFGATPPRFLERPWPASTTAKKKFLSLLAAPGEEWFPLRDFFFFSVLAFVAGPILFIGDYKVKTGLFAGIRDHRGVLGAFQMLSRDFSRTCAGPLRRWCGWGRDASLARTPPKWEYEPKQATAPDGDRRLYSSSDADKIWLGGEGAVGALTGFFAWMFRGGRKGFRGEAQFASG